MDCLPSKIGLSPSKKLMSLCDYYLKRTFQILYIEIEYYRTSGKDVLLDVN